MGKSNPSIEYHIIRGTKIISPVIQTKAHGHIYTFLVKLFTPFHCLVFCLRHLGARCVAPCWLSADYLCFEIFLSFLGKIAASFPACFLFIFYNKMLLIDAILVPVFHPAGYLLVISDAEAYDAGDKDTEGDDAGDNDAAGDAEGDNVAGDAEERFMCDEKPPAKLGKPQRCHHSHH
jgi:hypothetical protein